MLKKNRKGSLWDVGQYVLGGMRRPMVCAFLFVKSSGAHVRNENDERAW